MKIGLFKKILIERNTGKSVTQASLAAAMNISLKSAYNKCNGRTEFTISEINILKKDYNFSIEDINNIWFS